MRVVHVDTERREEWDSVLLREPNFALLQSWGWGEFKECLGWQAFRVAVEDQGRILAGAQMLVKPLGFGFASVAYVPRGPFGSWLDGNCGALLLAELHRVARLHHAVFLKVEPALADGPAAREALSSHGFRPTTLYNQPNATIVMNLEGGLDRIQQQMRKRTREYIGYSARHGVTVRMGSTEDLNAFTKLMRVTGRRERFPPRTHKYYLNQWLAFDHLGQAVLLMAYHEDCLLAVHMSFRFGDYAAYLHGGSSGELSGLRPNYLLIWEAIKWAQSQGCRAYDLWGIPDEVGQAVSQGGDAPVSERTDELWGVYRFKRGFSKDIVAYVGSWDFIYRLPLYILMTNRVLNAGTWESLSAIFDSVRR